MEDYNRVLEATSVAENANGVAAEKMTVYNESLEAAQNRLTASVQQFAQDSNLDRTLALAYDGLSKVVEILNILLNKIPVLSPLIKALGVALATAFAGNILKNIWETSNLIGQLPSLAMTATSAIGALNTTLFTIGSVAVPIWGVVAAITAIGAVAKVAWNAWKDAQPEAQIKKANEALQESQQSLDETNNKITEINKQISEINSKGTLTLADEQQKENLQEQLDLLEEIKTTQEAINKEKSAQALSAEQAKAKKMTTYSSEDVSQYQAGLQSTQNYATAISTENINELIAAYQQLEKEKKNLNSADEDYAEQLKTNEQLTSSFTTKLLEQKQSYLDEMKALSNLGDTSSETYKALQQAVDMINVTLDPSNFETLKVQNLIDTSGIEDKIKEAVQAGDKAGGEMATAYAKSFAEKILKDTSMKQSFAEAMGVNVNELNIDNLTQEILSKFQQMYNNISDGYNDVVQNVFSKTDVVSAYASILEKVNEKTKVLSKAYKELTKQGSLTTDTTQKLIELYPDLAKQLDFTSGKITLNVNVLKDLYNAEYKSAEATVKAEIQKTKATIAGVEARIAALEAERQKLLQTLDAGVLSGRDEAFAEKQMLLLEQSGSKANANLEKAEEHLKDLNSLLGLVQNTAKSGLGSGTKDSSSGKSGKSAADKAAKEFENEIKEKVQNLKSIVQLYSENANWDDPTVIKEFQDRYDKILNEVINDPKARKVLADAFNLDISNMPVEQQIQELTTLWQKQAGTIQESYQKLLKNLAKEDLSSAKAVIEKYKNGIYGAWSSDEALNAAKADYQKFIDKITNDADYRAAMAEALNLGDISGEPVEKQVEAVINALLKSTGTLDDTQQDLYDDASKNIKALQDEIEDMIDTAIGLLEKAGDFLFDMLDKISDRYDAQIDNLDKISDELDDQKDAFEDKIDQQKELLKLQKEEMDNADELAEKNKSIADIDAQLMELQYDNSAEAQAKRLKLLDERAQKEKDLADWQKDNDYNTKIDALDKEKSEYEKTIEAEKKAIEAQKQTLQDAQKQFETTLGNIQNGFNTFIKILSSDFVKNLISKALIGTGQDTVTQLLTGYNKLFGTGIDSDVTGIIKEGYKSLADIGSDTLNNVSNYNNRIVKSATKGIKSIISNTTNGVKSIFDSSNGFMKRLTSNGISSLNTIGTNGKGIISSLAGTANSLLSNLNRFASGIGQIATKGISGIFSGIGGMTSGVAGGMGGIGLAGAGLSSALPIAAIGAGVLSGALANVSTWYNNIKLWKDKDKSTGKKILGTIGNLILPFLPGGMLISAGKALSSLFKKHHTGADYVKKQNPMLDKMLGLGSDETVSILKVGEAIVPTWANGANSSGSSNRFTGSPFGSAVDSAVKTARVNTRTYSSSNSSSINISMPINIQGDADASTVNSLRKEADNIVNKVLKTINNQTRIGGYRNIKAATI